jgi:predicted nucleic acid-binding protein
VIVVDASVWVSRLVPDDVHYGASRLWLEQIVYRGEPLISPAILLAEIAGAVSRRTGESGLAERAVRDVLQVPGVRLVSIDRRLGQEAARLAARLHLRGADAVYVATARLMRLPLVTWDSEQHSRANALVSVRSPGIDESAPRS